ncbi:hypothetical protein AVEN_204777-1 [Araneus ventricosus]|uniref:Histone-lysine N-methyltransferase SETMAR n=1 Tax=Araneus ventricosus TaxID=182803 RepID=A0A4Y2SKV8_ARAVE|nr:hypothetical protein AVEN_204777-1 [Araneus ventricosus]
MFKIIESPAPCEVRSGYFFCRQETCLLQTFTGRFVKFTELLPCVKAKCVSGSETSKLARSGHPSVITDHMVASVEAKILEKRLFTISTLSNDLPEVSRSVLYKIVSEKLNFKKLRSRWVPKLLTGDHRNNRFKCSLNFLTRYNEEADAMLSWIVTGDETWVSHVTPESKQQSMKCRHTHSLL